MKIIPVKTAGEKKFLFDVVIVPILVALALRLLLKFGLHLRIGWMGTQDWDLLLAFALSGGWYAHLLYHYAPTVSAFRWRGLFATVLWIASTLAFALLVDPEATSRPLWKTVLFSGLVVSIASSLFWCHRVSYFSRHPKRALVVPALLMALSVPIYNHFGGMVWQHLGPVLSSAVCAVNSPMLPSIGCEMHGTSFTTIGAAGFGLMISQGCDGMVGILLWLVLCLTLRFLHRSKGNAARWASLFSVGLVLMFGLNVLRISLLLWGGILTANFFAGPTHQLIFEYLFHAHVGLILYAVGIHYYLRLALPLVGIKAAKNNFYRVVFLSETAENAARAGLSINR